MQRDAAQEQKIIHGIVIEPMCKNDVDAVVAVERRAFSAPWTEGMFVSEISHHPLSYVARYEGHVVGYIMVRIVFEEMSLMNLAVDLPWRKKGLGEALIWHAIGIGRRTGIERVILEVRISNVTAQNLYKKLGFQKVGCRRNYYNDPTEDALIFEHGTNRLL